MWWSSSSGSSPLAQVRIIDSLLPKTIFPPTVCVVKLQFRILCDILGLLRIESLTYWVFDMLSLWYAEYLAYWVLGISSLWHIESLIWQIENLTFWIFDILSLWHPVLSLWHIVFLSRWHIDSILSSLQNITAVTYWGYAIFFVTIVFCTWTIL